MTIETMDWEMEAKRIKLAFGLEAECCFEFEEFHEAMWLHPLPQCDETVNLTTEEGYELTVQYFEKTIWFSIGKDKGDKLSIELDRCGNPQIVDGKLEKAGILAKGLFHLGLLTGEVEAALKFNLTAHQKMEWALEYEAGLKAG